MSNYNPNYRRDTAASPPYSREGSSEDILQDRTIETPHSATLHPPESNPTGLSITPPSSSSAYAPHYVANSPVSTSPVNVITNRSPGPGSPRPSEGSTYKAYRPPVQQAYSTDSVIPSQPHGPYTAYQPPKPITSTQLPNVAPPRPSPVISPLVTPFGPVDNRPISPPVQRLPSPLTATAGAEPRLPAPGNYAPPSVSDSINSTPTVPRPHGGFPGNLPAQPTVSSGPFTPQGSTYHQLPQHEQIPSYIPPKPTQIIPTQQVPSYAPVSSINPPSQISVPGTSAVDFAAQQQSYLGNSAYPGGDNTPGYADSGYRPFDPLAQPQAYPGNQEQSSQAQNYPVELPSSPGVSNMPPKPSKQLSFTLPPSDIYAERIANYMNMLEKEASLSPTAAPTLGQPEPEDLETRRHKVFRDWVVSEAKIRGPKFATDLADELDSLSFGSSRASGQFTTKPRGSSAVFSHMSEISRAQASKPLSQRQVIQIDISKLLPLIYPPPPAKVTAAARLAPFQKTFSNSANLGFIEKNRKTFVANQGDIERKIQSEIDEVRRRRGKRNPQDAENLVREIRKREGQDAYERFDRDVVNSTYGELMKTAEVVETVKQGVEDFVKDNGNSLSTTELLEIFSFLTAVQDFSTTVHDQMESLLTERSMKYMYSLTVPLYEANDAAEAKKVEAWNQGVVAGQVADNKRLEEKRVGKYSKFVIESSDLAISREKAKSEQLAGVLAGIVRHVNDGLRDGFQIDFEIPRSEDIRPFDLTDEGKFMWLRSKILMAALALQGSMDSQKTLQKTKDIALRLAIKARYAALEADAVKQHPTNQQKNIEDINKLRERQAREIEELTRTEEVESEGRGVERGKFEATVRPAADALKAHALSLGGERVQKWLQDGREEVLLGWVATS